MRFIIKQHFFRVRDIIFREFELATQSLHLQIDIIVDDHAIRCETIEKCQVGFGALLCIL